ncbi:hybrid sensor histidine kinase/response regulator [Streptomyces griseus]|uniref:ATP-binding response regulator n=1 Tax=Streptomyces griseus TaxID=1911 RepID=UPI00069221BA|nr:hybrid sensor histidine kinase/response regulator [Streptomyces griseus]
MRTAEDHEFSDLPLSADRDVFELRRQGQLLCKALGLEGHELVRVVTVLSEVGRELLGSPALRVGLRTATHPDGVHLLASFTWGGPRRPGPETVRAAHRLLDHSRYSTSDEGHTLTVGQRLPSTNTPPEQLIERARAALLGSGDLSMGEELRSQNRQLLRALEESRAQQEELRRLNRELEETNQGVVALYSELSAELEETNTGVVALYAELEDKTRQLRLASEAKTRFWANVSHELRAPVNSVISLARLLMAPGADPLSDEQRQQLSLIAGSGSTLLALVEELLDVAKAESGRLEPVPADTDLRTLLHQLRGTLGGMAHEGVRLDIPDVSDAPPLVTDEVMLTRVLRNVLSNGLKFTTAGEVRLTVETETRGGRTWFAFTTTDTGVGIPQDQQERVFEEFYQVLGVHQRGRPGTGLGLPYARRLTTILGGTLRLTSAPGEGTTVRVEIPAHLGASAGGARDGDAAREAEPTARLGSLVVVDDDPTFLGLLRPTLEDIADDVTEVTVSSRAFDVIRDRRPDAILIDLVMPAPDGYTLLGVLARDPVTARIPVVVLTSTDPSEVDRTRLTHARTVLSKTHLTRERILPALGLAPELAAPPPPAGDTPAESGKTTE